jgi:hypothetical protein
VTKRFEPGSSDAAGRLDLLEKFLLILFDKGTKEKLKRMRGSHVSRESSLNFCPFCFEAIFGFEHYFPIRSLTLATQDSWKENIVQLEEFRFEMDEVEVCAYRDSQSIGIWNREADLIEARTIRERGMTPVFIMVHVSSLKTIAGTSSHKP